MMRLFTGMIIKKMKKLNIPDFEELKAQAIDLGVNLYACSTSMTIMNVKKEDLIEGAEVLGAAKFLDIAADSEVVATCAHSGRKASVATWPSRPAGTGSPSK